MTDQNDILGKEDKGLTEARGVLTHIFRKILMERGVNSYVWDRYMRSYLQNPLNQVPQNSKDRSSARGNLNKELRRDKMSWKVFVKALRFLGPMRIKFEVHLLWGNGETTVHSVELTQNHLSTEAEDDSGS